MSQHDEQVKKGALLLVQRSPDLEKEIVAAEGEINKSDSKLRSANRQLNDNDDLTEVDRGQLQREVSELTETIKSFRKQLELLKQKEATAGNPQPHRRACRHLERVRPAAHRSPRQPRRESAGDRRPDQGVGTRSADARKADGAPREGGVIVERQAAGHVLPRDKPGRTVSRAEVEEVERSAEVRGEEGNTVLVRVSFDQQVLRSAIADPKIGASATAKVECGKRAIGYVWFHDLVDFIRAKILFRIF